MERRKEEHIGDVVMRFLRQQGIETPLNEHRLMSIWYSVVGDESNRQTEDLRIYNQTLYVQIKSAALRSQLFMQRSNLVKQLNDLVGADVIHDIVLKA